MSDKSDGDRVDGYPGVFPPIDGTHPYAICKDRFRTQRLVPGYTRSDVRRIQVR